jgi:hypothetical protein
MAKNPMIWIRGRASKGHGSQSISFSTSKIAPPRVVWEATMPDYNQMWTDSLNAVLKFTEAGARQFASASAAVIRDHVKNFSMPTKASGRTGGIGQFDTFEVLDRSGQSLYESIGWDVFKNPLGDWEGEAGPGVGKGKQLPVNVKGKTYVGFVERGTGPTKRRFVPKVVDIELVDQKDPTNIRKFLNVPKEWAPKMAPNVNELLEGWWASKKRRALMKKRHRKAMGRYWATQSLGKGGIYATKLKGARKAMDRGRPKYLMTSSKGVGPGGPPAGYGLVYHRRRFRQKEPLTFDLWKKFHKLSGGDTQRTFEMANEFLEETLSLYDEFVDVMGGPLRGYGGVNNILRSAGDISYAYFTMDLRMTVLDMTDFDYGMLEGKPGNVQGFVENERGLGVRIPQSRWGGDPGEHPGTPARNFMLNSAVVMARKLQEYIAEANSNRGIVKGRHGGLRMFRSPGVAD